MSVKLTLGGVLDRRFHALLNLLWRNNFLICHLFSSLVILPANHIPPLHSYLLVEYMCKYLFRIRNYMPLLLTSVNPRRRLLSCYAFLGELSGLNAAIGFKLEMSGTP